MPRKFEKSDIFFTNVIENPDGTRPRAREPDDLPSGAAEFSLQRLHLLSRRVKTSLEKLLENVHEDVTKITLNFWRKRPKQGRKWLLGFLNLMPARRPSAQLHDLVSADPLHARWFASSHDADLLMERQDA